MQMQGVRQTSPSDWSDSIRTKGSDDLQHTVWSRWYINVATFQWTGENVSSARLTPAHLSQETDLQENHSSSIFHHGGKLVFCSLHRSPENPSIITNKQTECTHTLTHTVSGMCRWWCGSSALLTETSLFPISHWAELKTSIGCGSCELHLTSAASRVSGGRGQPVTSTRWLTPSSAAVLEKVLGCTLTPDDLRPLTSERAERRKRKFPYSLISYHTFTMIVIKWSQAPAPSSHKSLLQRRSGVIH